jgi:hypothetical protein
MRAVRNHVCNLLLEQAHRIALPRSSWPATPVRDAEPMTSPPEIDRLRARLAQALALDGKAEQMIEIVAVVEEPSTTSGCARSWSAVLRPGTGPRRTSTPPTSTW